MNVWTKTKEKCPQCGGFLEKRMYVKDFTIAYALGMTTTFVILIGYNLLR